MLLNLITWTRVGNDRTTIVLAVASAPFDL